jgi:hypothetical protein
MMKLIITFRCQQTKEDLPLNSFLTNQRVKEKVGVVLNKLLTIYFF